jgi:hypothetical protein
MDGKPKTCISSYLGGLGQGCSLLFEVVRHCSEGFIFWGWVFSWSLLLCRSKVEGLKI